VAYARATIYHQTGTGNTRRMASWMSGAAGQTGEAILVRSISQAAPCGEFRGAADQRLSLPMPTHGFAAPLGDGSGLLVPPSKPA
jgi:hypothetical protein